MRLILSFISFATFGCHSEDKDAGSLQFQESSSSAVEWKVQRTSDKTAFHQVFYYTNFIRFASCSESLDSVSVIVIFDAPPIRCKNCLASPDSLMGQKRRFICHQGIWRNEEIYSSIDTVYNGGFQKSGLLGSIPSCVKEQEGNTYFSTSDTSIFICRSGNWKSLGKLNQAALNTNFELNSRSFLFFDSLELIPPCDSLLDKKKAVNLTNLMSFQCINNEWLYQGRLRSSIQMEFISFRDARDGNIYRTQRVGSRIWFLDNLRYKSDRSWMGNHFKGRYYAETNVLKVCPDGWRVPNRMDIWELALGVGGFHNAGGILKKWGWNVSAQGSRALSDAQGQDHFSDASWWVVDSIPSFHLERWLVLEKNGWMIQSPYRSFSRAFPVRCVKDAPSVARSGS